MIKPSPLATDTAVTRLAAVRTARHVAVRLEAMREAEIERQLAELDRSITPVAGPVGGDRPSSALAAPSADERGPRRARRWRMSRLLAAAGAVGTVLAVRYGAQHRARARGAERARGSARAAARGGGAGTGGAPLLHAHG